MRKMIPAVLVITALAAMPAFAAQATSGSKPKPATSGSTAAAHPAAKPASHSTSGKVKSVDATTLVVAKSGGKDMTFMMDPSTTKEGTIEVGSDVVVRYHADGKMNMATAVTAKPAKAKK